METEALALRRGAALIDRSTAGRLRLTGADRLDLLHRTSTGALKDLAPGAGATTVIQTETAKIIDWLTLYHDPDETLVTTARGRAAAVAAWIDRIVIMDDVLVEDVTASTAQLELCGPGARALLGRFAGPELLVGLGAPHAHAQAQIDGVAVRICAGRMQEPPYYELILPASALDAVCARLRTLGATPVSKAAAESLRVELGVPAVGHELTLDANPLEARLHASISFTKGCYTGQEVIAKMITYKSTKRTLVGFRLAGPLAAPAPDHWYPIRQGDEIIGRLTSAVWSPLTRSWLGLGIVRNEVSPAGTLLRVEAAGHPVGGGPKLGVRLAAEAETVDAVVAALPFDVGVRE